MRLSSPCSRRNVMFIAIALNVDASRFMPAMPGITMSRSLAGVSEPMISRKTIGSTKLKNAAVGLRQNCLRSRRNCRQPRTAASDMDRLLRFGGQLEVDVLEAGARDGQLAHGAAAGERVGGQLVQQVGGVVDLALLQLAVLAAPGHPHPLGGADAELAGRSDREDPAVLDDRHAV